MKSRYCNNCQKMTWHNPFKKDKETQFRCTGCGHPKRYGAKNYGVKVGGRVIMEARP